MGFLLLAFNQIANNAGMLRYTSGGNFKIPMVIRGPGGVGRQLGAEHSQRLEAYFHAVPGLKIVACSTPYNAKGLLKSAIRDNNPVLFFEHVLLYNLKEISIISRKIYLIPSIFYPSIKPKSFAREKISPFSPIRGCVITVYRH